MSRDRDDDGYDRDWSEYGETDREPGRTRVSPGKVTVSQRIRTAPIQAQAVSGANTAGEAPATTGGGQPLQPEIQHDWNQAFSTDFSDVRVHADSPAPKQVGAIAYTQGSDVHFAPGQFNPTSPAGKDLLGHELTHVVQQRQGRVAADGQGKGDIVNSDPSLEREADQVGARAARGENVAMGGAGGSVSGAHAPVQRQEDGISGGRVSHGDFMGGASNEVERGRVARDSGAEDIMSMQAQVASINTGSARTERDMLIAIENGSFPRFVARVGARDDFGYGTFANPNRPFVFATEPADLRGCSPAEAMYKVGWTKEWIEPKIGKEIVVCVFDTSKVVSTGGTDNTRAKVKQGRMEWPQLTAAALADAKFTDAAEARAIPAAELPELLEICSNTPVKGTPATADPNKQRKCLIVRELIDSLYGANALYTGMGATMQEDGELGGREVMIKENGTGLKLTDNNHSFASLGELTRDHYDALP